MISIFSNESFLAFLAVNILLAAGLYPMVVTGQLSVGQAGFMAVGAYASSWANVELGWPLPPAILLAIVFAAVVAVPVAVGANRVEGIYLIIATLAVGEIIRTGLSSMNAIGGVQGYIGMDLLSYGQVWLGTLVALVVLFVVMRSSVGIAMRSIRDDEDAAATAGVAIRTLKIGAVVFGAALTGLAGALFAHNLGVIKPEYFDVRMSFLIALFVLIGGSDNLAGPVIGAFILTYAPQAFQPVREYREVVYGLFLLGVMILSPRGLVTRDRTRKVGAMLAGMVRHARPSTSGAVAPAANRGQAEFGPPAGPSGPSAQLPVLSLKEVGKRFSGVVALNRVDLTVRAGEIIGLIGPNGAGKTTLVNVATGLLRATTGSIAIRGRDVSGYPAHRRTRAGMGRTFQAVRLFRHLTVEENLAVPARVRDGPRVRALLERFGLSPEGARLPGELAYGIQRRIQMAQGLGSGPLVLFLDEPSIGLNEAESSELASLLRSVRDAGTAIVLVDHDLDLVMSLADRVVVLDHGEKLSEGTPDEVRRDPDVQVAYLGSPGTGGSARPRAAEPGAEAPWILEVSDLVTRYGKVAALHGVTLRVGRGETVAVVGRNGAGKTTLLRSIFGYIRPSEGSVDFDGAELVGRPPHRMARAGIAYVPEGRAVLGRLSVRENLELAALGAGTRGRERLDEVFDLFPPLAQGAKSPAAILSGGQQQMLSIGRALMSSPSLLMLDEPSLGLAPTVVADLFASLARLGDSGMTILLIELNVRRAMSIGARGYLLLLGRIEMEAAADEILSDDRLLSAYLGGPLQGRDGP